MTPDDFPPDECVLCYEPAVVVRPIEVVDNRGVPMVRRVEVPLCLDHELEERPLP